jgi:hypothetical protein
MLRTTLPLLIALATPAAWAQAGASTSSVATASVSATLAAPAPVVVEPAPAAPAAKATLALALTADAGTTLHQKAGDAYTELCTAPCEVSLAPGTYRLGLSRGGAVVPVASPVSVASTSKELVGRYVSATPSLIGGAVVAAASIAGAVLGIVGTTSTEDGEPTDYVPLGAGVVGGSLGLAVGIAMMLVSDSAEVEAR